MRINLKLLTWLIPALKIIWKIVRRKNIMEKVDIDKLADEVIADLVALKEEAKQVKGVKDALQILPAVIKKVEEISGGVKIAGAQKKELAVAVLNKLVDIPWVPEAAEAMLIGLAIDAVVAAFNRLLGTAWLAKIV